MQQCGRHPHATFCRDPSLQITHLQKTTVEILDTSISRDEAQTVRSKSHQAKSWICDC